MCGNARHAQEVLLLQDSGCGGGGILSHKDRNTSVSPYGHGAHTDPWERGGCGGVLRYARTWLAEGYVFSAQCESIGIGHVGGDGEGEGVCVHMHAYHWHVYT